MTLDCSGLNVDSRHPIIGSKTIHILQDLIPGVRRLKVFRSLTKCTFILQSSPRMNKILIVV
jgi:hypothetical protein